MDLNKLVGRGASKAEPYVTICGDGWLLIENISTVCECNEIMIRIKSRGLEIIVWGEEMTVENYINNSCQIRGRIKSVELFRREGAK